MLTEHLTNLHGVSGVVFLSAELFHSDVVGMPAPFPDSVMRRVFGKRDPFPISCHERLVRKVTGDVHGQRHDLPKGGKIISLEFRVQRVAEHHDNRVLPCGPGLFL